MYVNENIIAKRKTEFEINSSEILPVCIELTKRKKTLLFVSVIVPLIMLLFVKTKYNIFMIIYVKLAILSI